MYSQVQAPVAGPPAPLDHLLGAALSDGLLVLAAAVLGWVAARSMRARGLHWSWSGAVLAAAIVFMASSAELAAVTAAGALVCAALGARGQRRDMREGSGNALLAQLRLRPHDLLRPAWRALTQGRGRTTDDLPLGLDARRREVAVPFAGHGAHHTLIVGATGSGKTVTQTLMVTSAIERGLAAIVLDPKGDGELRERMRAATIAAGRRLLTWTPEGPSFYNPYSHGQDGEIADRLLAGETFTEPHYQRQAQRYIGAVVRLMRACGRQVSLAALASLMDPERAIDLAGELAAPHGEHLLSYLRSLDARQRAGLSGIRDRLAILTESDVGRWLEPAAGGDQLSLLRCARAGDAVYLSLRADGRPLIAAMLAAAFVGDMRAMVARLHDARAPVLVVIDEFSAVGAHEVLSLFERARSAGVSVALGTQELEDLRKHGVLDGVLGNSSSVIAHRQSVPRSAELIAAMSLSRRSAGRRASAAPSRSIDAADVMGLSTGWAAVLVPQRARAAIVRIDARPRGA